MKSIVKPLIKFLNEVKNSYELTENHKAELDYFLCELNKLTGPNFDPEKCAVLVTKIITWMGLTEKVLNELIDLWTHHK